MSDLREIGKKVLSEKKAEFIIGFSEDRNKHVKPFIAKNAEDADKLTFNHYAVNNLAVYLHRFKNKVDGKIGIVVKNCDLKAVTALIQENQIKRDDLYIIGVNCSGVVREKDAEWTKENAQIKCKYCQQRVPSYYDELAGEPEELLITEDDQQQLMNSIEKMSANERLEYFQNQFDKCVKCYACREVCPMCYCEQCIVEKSSPQWIDTSATSKGNFSWHIIRAFHMAGRCIGCHECERVCPADIPLTLLTRKMGMTAFAEFGYRHGTAIDQPTLIGTYNTSDKEDFIK